MYDEEGIYGLGIEIKTKQNAIINLFKTESGVKKIAAAFETEGQITGWNHIDITRDEEGHSTVYLNREPIKSSITLKRILPKPARPTTSFLTR
jgi:hypothetical protein